MPNTIQDDTDDLIKDSIDNQDETVDSTSSDIKNMLQLSNIVYPSENIKRCYGKGGFENYFQRVDGVRGKRIQYKTSVSEQILSYDNIHKYAPKIKTILDYIIQSKGIVFVYSQYYYSGIVPLAIALEHIGFNKLDGNLTDKLQVQQLAPLINDKRPNYVILSREKEFSPNNIKEIATAKSIENMRGEKIKVIIVSKIGTEGIDFKRIREIHLLDPWYNLNRAEQIIGRGVRTCSHIDLPKEERNTSIYMHATTMREKEIESVDLRVYRIAENKQHAIRDVETILKENAIDCYFNMPNLSFPKSKLKTSFDIVSSQGIILPKYTIGDTAVNIHTCRVSSVPKIDPSTYSYEIIEDEISMYKKLLSSLYRITYKYSYKEIIKSFELLYFVVLKPNY